MQEYNEAKLASQRHRSELQAKCNSLEEQLTKALKAQDEASQRAAECTQLWESEVQSRTKLGVKMMEMEKFAGTWEARLNKERERTALALDRKRALESKWDDLSKKNATLEARAATSEQRSTILDREMDRYKSGAVKPPAVLAEMESMRTAQLAEVERLRNELATAHSQAQQMAEARATAAIQQATKLGNLVPRSEVELYKKQADIRAQQAIDERIGEINNALAHGELAHEANLLSLGQQVSDTRAELAAATLGRIHAESELAGLRAATDPRARLAWQVGEARSKLAVSSAKLSRPPKSAVVLDGTAADAAVARARSRARLLVSSVRTGARSSRT